MRISSSIIRNYYRNLTNRSFKDQLDYAQVDTGKFTKGVKHEALRVALNVTYVDLSPYETLKSRPYLLNGKIFEALLNGSLDESNLVTFKDRRTKKAREDIEGRCKQLGDKALPVSDKTLRMLKETVTRTLGMRLDPEITMLTGLSTIKEFVESDNTAFNVNIQHNLKINGTHCTLTGECDMLHTTDNDVSFIGEIKTSSKLFYANGITKQIEANNYNFQVEFYHFLLSLAGYHVYNKALFTMVNPSRNVVATKSYPVGNTVKDILMSLEP